MRGNIVYTYVVADLLHKGHMLYLRNAKDLAGEGGKLIVGVLTDKAVMEKKPKPTIPFSERIDIVKALRFVDCAVAQDTYSPLNNVMSLKPDLLIESSSHKEMPANDFMKSQGKQVIVFPYYPEQSSTEIKETIRNYERQE